jgi:peptidoglycan/LPS O-acetylase OafA/YrhL
MAGNPMNHNLPLIRTLTSLRFFAALMVFFSHIHDVVIFNHHRFFDFIWKNVCYEGYIGVTFFFILSGFILTYNYNHLINNKQISTLKFLSLRAARIYPTHLLCFFISLLPYFFLYRSILAGIFNLFLLQSFIPIVSVYFSFNAPSWSISNEAFFYLIFCSLLLINYKNILKLWTLNIMLVIGFLFLFSNKNDIIQHWIFYINPFMRILDFITGIVLAKIFFRVNHIIKNINLLKILEPISILLLAIFVFIAVKYNVNQSLRYDIYYIIPLGLIIFIFSFEEGLISKILANKICVFLGEISFAFYMFHYLIRNGLAFLQANFKIFLPTTDYGKAGLVLLILLTSLIVSSLSFIFYERPLNRFLRKRFINRDSYKETQKLEVNNLYNYEN